MGKNRIKKFIVGVIKMIKKENKKLKVNIKVKYLIGSKSHEKEFTAYALYGQWHSKNWRRIRIVDVSVEGDY